MHKTMYASLVYISKYQFMLVNNCHGN
uniref:Uncharacterized protein n=2 Tax=Anguilla anguilla TaxID=7936 RepID=A0A0E9USA3_ANGAN